MLTSLPLIHLSLTRSFSFDHKRIHNSGTLKKELENNGRSLQLLQTGSSKYNINVTLRERGTERETERKRERASAHHAFERRQKQVYIHLTESG